MPDSPSAWLRSLAAKATPGGWVVIMEDDREAYVWSHGAMRDVIVRPEPWEEGGVSDADARLIALAPDLAVLCADMEHFIRFSVNRGTRVGNISARDLLARFAALQPEREEERRD